MYCLLPRPCTYGEIVTIRHASYVPHTEVLIEQCCLVEHYGHIHHGGSVPVAYVLIEGSVGEHVAHVGDGGNFPVADVLIEP